jgi:hypothetical protein
MTCPRREERHRQLSTAVFLGLACRGVQTEWAKLWLHHTSCSCFNTLVVSCVTAIFNITNHQTVAAKPEGSPPLIQKLHPVPLAQTKPIMLSDVAAVRMWLGVTMTVCAAPVLLVSGHRPCRPPGLPVTGCVGPRGPPVTGCVGPRGSPVTGRVGPRGCLSQAV